MLQDDFNRLIICLPACLVSLLGQPAWSACLVCLPGLPAWSPCQSGLPVCLKCLLVSVSVYWYEHISFLSYNCLSIFSPFYLSLHLSMSLSVYPSVQLCICQRDSCPFENLIYFCCNDAERSFLTKQASKLILREVYSVNNRAQCYKTFYIINKQAFRA
jgi:hypothetical protein